MSHKLKVVLADDEQMARTRLARLLSALPDIELCAECENVEQLLEQVRKQPVDVVLLDIHMPGLSGLDALGLLPANGPYVIFCTAHTEHAVQAFDVGAVDYLLKPIEAARLSRALERARQRRAALGPPGQLEALPRLAISTRQGIVLVDPSQISHAVLDGELVTVFTPQGALLTEYSLQELQERLPPDRFERVHRRALLNLEHTARLEPLPSGGYLAHTHSGHTVDVSRQSARELRRRLGLRKGDTDRD